MSNFCFKCLVFRLQIKILWGSLNNLLLHIFPSFLQSVMNILLLFPNFVQIILNIMQLFLNFSSLTLPLVIIFPSFIPISPNLLQFLLYFLHSLLLLVELSPQIPNTPNNFCILPSMFGFLLDTVFEIFLCFLEVG